jgi:nucleoside-diphosphate-sugar epimerase
MKISILGTNGFLSTAIAKYAHKAGWSLEMYGLHKPIGHEYDKFYEVNLMSTELECSNFLDSDLIVYAIGAGIQANLKEGFNLIYNLNVTAPVNICNKLKELGYKGHFVTFGSVFEIGEIREKRFFSESDVRTSLCPAPNDYTVSKRMLSAFVSSYSHDFTHWHFYIPTIYGAGENPKRLLPYIINAIRNGEDLHFTAGDQTRQYVHVNEIPRMLVLAMEKKLPSGVYNIQGSETLTVKEIVTMVHHAMGKKVPEGCFGSVHRADVGMKYLALDGKKLREAIGFEAKIKIVDVLETY